MTKHICPNCEMAEMSLFYEVDRAPVHSVLLMRTRERALGYPTGTIRLAYCENCGFVSNVAFEPSLHEYSEEYEATQSYSPTFNEFNRELAQHLVDKYDLHDKTIIEIGCGHGEFLILLSELGPNEGVGFDPAYIEERIQHPAKGNITFIQDFYSEKYGDVHGDFIVCKMTLEHIPDTADFLATVRKSIGNRLGTRVFFQVPNAGYVLQDVAFWDIYYEHCSYFSKASLVKLFTQAGFQVTDVFSGYDDQYLMIEASAGQGDQEAGSLKLMLEESQHDVEHFVTHIKECINDWQVSITELAAAQRKIVIWGSGSKAVAFLTALDITDELEFVVDINPNKWGTFMVGTGQEIVGPGFLVQYEPDLIIVMNPIYVPEIVDQLDSLGLSPEITTIAAPLKIN